MGGLALQIKIYFNDTIIKAVGYCFIVGYIDQQNRPESPEIDIIKCVFFSLMAK